MKIWKELLRKTNNQPLIYFRGHMYPSTFIHVALNFALLALFVFFISHRCAYDITFVPCKATNRDRSMPLTHIKEKFLFPQFITDLKAYFLASSLYIMSYKLFSGSWTKVFFTVHYSLQNADLPALPWSRA